MTRPDGPSEAGGDALAGGGCCSLAVVVGMGFRTVWVAVSVRIDLVVIVVSGSGWGCTLGRRGSAVVGLLLVLLSGSSVAVMVTVTGVSDGGEGVTVTMTESVSVPTDDVMEIVFVYLRDGPVVGATDEEGAAERVDVGRKSVAFLPRMSWAVF